MPTVTLKDPGIGAGIFEGEAEWYTRSVLDVTFRAGSATALWK
jgi:hypothetical protein